MTLPVPSPVAPMLSKRVDRLPDGEGWLFEPKWDGFRTLVFKDGSDVLLQSRDEKPMTRYFPEIVPPLLASLPEKCVLDGEIVLVTQGGLDFEALQMRIHPAASRVKTLSEQAPVSMVFWDVLALADTDVRGAPFAERRKALEKLLEHAKPPIHVTPLTDDRSLAEDWFRRFEGAGLDGVMAKRASGTYEAGKRAMLKIKHERTCDAVVAGFRWHKNGRGTHVGSLLLGLWSGDQLHHVGVTATFTDAKRKELVELLAPYREGALDGHPWRAWSGAEVDWSVKKPGMKSRWSTDKTLDWEALRPELVVEVAYDHMQGRRFRHTAQFRRWRTDKRPAECTFDQLEVTPPYELAAIFAAR